MHPLIKLCVKMCEENMRESRLIAAKNRVVGDKKTERKYLYMAEAHELDAKRIRALPQSEIDRAGEAVARVIVSDKSDYSHMIDTALPCAMKLYAAPAALPEGVEYSQRAWQIAHRAQEAQIRVLQERNERLQECINKIDLLVAEKEK